MTALDPIPIAKPSVGEQEWEALKEPIFKGWLTQGPQVEAFEKAFAKRHKARYALAVSNCTTALHLILSALGIGPGDEVIVPAFTWVATANAAVYCGATPVLADVDETTYNLDAEQVARKVTSKTKAVIAVHLFGLCADMDAIKDAAPGVPIIEDAACAAGAAYKGDPAGSLGVAAAFSFHPRKIITTGEGGMVTTNDRTLASKMEKLRNHGASISEEQRHIGPKPYHLPEFDLLGYNYRMSDLQGAVGLVQLGKLDGFIGERKRLASFYNQELKKIKWLTTPLVPEYAEHSYQSYVCIVNDSCAPMPRDQIMACLQMKGISTRPGTHAVHTLAYYRKQFAYQPDNYPVSWHLDRSSIAIPLHNRLREIDLKRIVNALHELK
ncbi:MAG: DegT/DnrJ/EryC1/StrS family aminotransferase [Deltaproteobacteria bacterium]|nr:DegT/DnrJ/EryC1/StrS family aminotransferase [Deltaproteobacteria bacterium]